ncbi:MULTISPECIES: phosphotriesterase [unclassified Micromonospora]|uniref:phosphotriesterase family protein n=1 Tax=unclassified Micromonospora TaxID=2617518 RepID=UPI001033D35B|nr:MULTISPECIES: phosphotriesterase [unclassified Micromonospora]QKW13962.1 phosphotriesterase [Verrucosispora sp. NA02020]TBL27575.1 phosphotriesterase [Verrucosispora sp. SN26_14.1]
MSAGRIVTVLGEIDPATLGTTLMHEHLYIRLWEIPGRFDVAGLPDDDDLLVEELTAFTAQGGNALVELTVPGIGREPARMAALARRTGLHIVMGCGWYRQPYYPAAEDVDRRSVDQLADRLVEEIRHGADGTGVRPGIIGEIGADKSWISAQEERCHRAAARASRRTGLAIATHSVGSDVGLHALDLFEEEGVAPDRVVIGHADSHPSLAFYRTALDRGAWLSFDNLGAFPPAYTERILDAVATLLGEGHHRIVLSQDVCKRDMFALFGGNGYGYVLGSVLPGLRARGVAEEQLHRLTVENPREVLTVAAVD